MKLIFSYSNVDLEVFKIVILLAAIYFNAWVRTASRYSKNGLNPAHYDDLHTLLSKKKSCLQYLVISISDSFSNTVELKQKIGSEY